MRVSEVVIMSCVRLLMKTTWFALGLLCGSIACVPELKAQPVLVAGGGSPYAYTPGVVASPAPAAEPIYAAPQQVVVYATPAPTYVVPEYQVVSGGYYNPPNVVYFGGANSCYNSSYPGPYYQPGCPSYLPSVIYFGRGEACQRGYAFRHPR